MSQSKLEKKMKEKYAQQEEEIEIESQIAFNNIVMEIEERENKK